MSDVTIAAIREGIRANLAAVLEPDWQVSAYMLAAPQGLCVDVYPDKVEFDTAMRRGSDQPDMIVRARVAATLDQAMQVKLDGLIDPVSATSVKAAVEADRTLGGSVEDCRVTEASGYRLYDTAQGAPALGVEFTVETIT